jgi:transcriptional regulator with XRE-family HTH domain
MSAPGQTLTMSDVDVGRSLRAVRVRLRLRQQDVADAAGISRQVVSRVECGQIDRVSIDKLRRIADRLGVRIDLVPRWRGGHLDRLLNRRHTALHEAAIGLVEAAPGWQVVSELSFNIRGERGVIDLVGWHPADRALLIGELKSEFVDQGELVATMDRRRRLAILIARERGWDPRVIGGWVIVADNRTNRRHLAASRRLLRGAFSADGTQMAAWLRMPKASISGLSFIRVPTIGGNGVRVTRRRTSGRAPTR